MALKGGALRRMTVISNKDEILKCMLEIDEPCESGDVVAVFRDGTTQTARLPSRYAMAGDCFCIDLKIDLGDE
jgi:hypothetical protein